MSSDPRQIRILSVDDHPLIRQGIAGLVAAQADMNVIAEAADGREAIEQFRLHRPDITLMDLQMPQMSGLDAIIAIRGEFPEARIIVLTTYAGDVQVLRALKAGAQAYLLKDTLHKELLGTIRAVYAGKKSLSPEISYQLAEHATDEALTAAEVRVVRLIAEGNANKEIAAQLSISEDTVKGQVRNILSKLGAKDRTQAAMIAFRRGSSSSDPPERVPRFNRSSVSGRSGKPITFRRYAPTFLHLRPWIPCRWTPAHAPSVRYRAPRGGVLGAAWQAVARTRVAPGLLRGFGNTADRRSLDSGHCIGGGARGAVECLLGRSPLALDHAGHARCRLGTDRAGRLVARCLALRLEAVRHSTRKSEIAPPLTGPLCALKCGSWLTNESPRLGPI